MKKILKDPLNFDIIIYGLAFFDKCFWTVDVLYFLGQNLTGNLVFGWEILPKSLIFNDRFSTVLGCQSSEVCGEGK